MSRIAHQSMLRKRAIRCLTSSLSGVLLAMCVLPVAASGQTTFDWVNPAGGSFTATGNWSPTGLPGAADIARFGTFNSAYTVGFIGSPTNAGLQINNGAMTFEPLGVFGVARTYNITAEAIIDGGTLTVASNGDDTLELAITGTNYRVGDTGVGSLTIERGGIVSNSVFGFIGFEAGSTGTITVDGAGSMLTNGNAVHVGHAGDGTLLVQNGGFATGLFFNIAENSNSTGRITVDGEGSMLAATRDTNVGGSGDGRLLISDGGVVSNENAIVASSSTGTGQVTVTGAGSMWTNSGDLNVAGVGTGTLTIEDGGAVSSARGIVANRSGSAGTATVRGAGSTWLNSGSLTVGEEGAGTLTIQDGGVVSSTTGAVGDNLDGVGNVTVDGAGSLWHMDGGFVVGNVGNGSVTVENGGRVFNEVNASIGDEGGTGTVIVRGADSAWENTGDLIVGLDGDGSLTVENGGSVSNRTSVFGGNATGDGEVTVRGAGSRWISSGPLAVGFGGFGSLAIEDGGTVSSASSGIGATDGSIGVVTVSGAGSLWDITGDLTVGEFGLGRLTLTDHGEVAVTSDISVSPFSQIRLFGGKLTVPTLDEEAVAALNWQSGTLNLTDPAGLTVGSGGLLGDSVGAANKSLELGGPLTIESGASFVGGPVLSATAIQVQPGSHFVLVGTTVHGPVTNPAGAVMNIIGDVTFNDLVSGAGGFFGSGTAVLNGGHNPGDSPAVVAVEGSLAYGGNNTLTIELAGLLTGEFDRLEVQGDVFLDGDLAVELLSGFTPSVGDEFEIFDIDGLLNGQFIGLFDGALIDAGDGAPLQISYAGGDGNSVVLTAVPTPILGDTFPLDGVVDINDLNAVRNNFGAVGTETPMVGDTYPFDGEVNIADLNAVRNNFGATSPAAVPEPAGVVLLVLGWCVLSATCRRVETA